MAAPFDLRQKPSNAADPPPDASPDDVARFGQFIAWLLAATLVFGTLEILAAIILSEPRLGLAGVLSLGYGACAWFAGRLLRHGRLRAAVMLAALGLLVLILVGAPVMPILYPTLIVLLLVIVVLAMPYLRGRHMLWLIGTAWVAGLFIAAIGNLLPPWPPLPDWFADVLRISTSAAALALACLLLWQYARRLNHLLADSRAANRALQDQAARRAQAEAALAASEKRFRALIENSADTILLLDEAGRPIYASPSAERLWGWVGSPTPGADTAADLAAERLAVIHPEDRLALVERFNEARHHPGQLVDAQYRVHSPAGDWRWVSATLQNLLAEPSVQAVVINFHDITQRRQAEEQLQRRLEELEAVNRLSRALRTAETIDQMLNVWLDQTIEVMHGNGGSVWLYDPAGDELRPAVIRGWTQAPGAGPVQPQRPGSGVNGHAFISRRPYLSNDFSADPRVAEGTRERIPPGGGVSIPIPVGDQVIGTFTVNLPPGRQVTDGDVALLSTLAEIAGGAIQRTRYYEQIEQRLGQLSALREIDLTITSSLDLRVMLGVLLEQVVSQLKVSAADILLFNPALQTLQYTLGRGFRTNRTRDWQLTIGESRAGQVVLDRRVLIVSDLRAAGPVSRRTGPLINEGFVGYVGAPLIAKGQVLGVLEMFQRTTIQPDAGWLDFLASLAGQAAIALDNARLFDSLQQSNQELMVAYDNTIEGWSAALDLRDKETKGHSQRVTEMTLSVAEALGFSPQQLIHVRRGALLHDVGKMAIPDSILLKPGPLSEAEWAIMRQHPTYAYQMLEPIRFLRPALEIPYCHHEHWDGHGYPQGLAGERIPQAARIFTVADVWEALRSDRPYRAAWSRARALDTIREQSGKQFEPAVVEAFLSLEA